MALKKFKNLGTIISIITLVLAFFVFLFGNGILSKFSGPKIEMDSYFEEFPIPEKLVSLIGEKNVELPDSIRFITIRNEGGEPSRNLNIKLETEGEVFQYSISSTEKIKDHSSKDSSIYVNMDRLSKNAQVNLVVWLRSDGNRFSGVAVDDIKSGIIVYSENRNKVPMNFANTLAMSLVIISLGFFSSEMIKRFTNRFEIQSEKNINDFNNIILDLGSELIASETEQLNTILKDDKNREQEYVDRMKRIVYTSKLIK